MVIDKYQEKNQNGRRLVYKKGSTVLHNGVVYVCVRRTENSPQKEPKAWLNTGFLEPYEGNTPPVKPLENQLWINNREEVFIWKKEFGNYGWVKI
jgi:hypothetical protein